ncbi:MAG: hypothetical protein CL530_04190 [Aequorivita sp.]|nr:hypothetical protein [Aequorivita sp.]
MYNSFLILQYLLKKYFKKNLRPLFCFAEQLVVVLLSGCKYRTLFRSTKLIDKVFLQFFQFNL